MPTMTTNGVIPTRVVEKHDAYAELLRFAFNQVCNPDDWKASIDALVPWEAANVYMQAIEHMTGVTPSCVRLGVRAHLTCIGYRAGPCGDH